MNETNRLERLAQAARGEPPPRIDVTRRVLEAIAERQPTTDWPLAILAATSSIAAAIVAVAAVRAWLAWQDPLASLFRSLDVVLQ